MMFVFVEAYRSGLSQSTSTRKLIKAGILLTKQGDNQLTQAFSFMPATFTHSCY
jgi:hypothetical protein